MYYRVNQLSAHAPKRSAGWRHVPPSVCVIILYLDNKRVPASLLTSVLVRRSPGNATSVHRELGLSAILASVTKSKYNEVDRQTDRQTAATFTHGRVFRETNNPRPPPF